MVHRTLMADSSSGKRSSSCTWIWVIFQLANSASDWMNHYFSSRNQFQILGMAIWRPILPGMLYSGDLSEFELLRAFTSINSYLVHIYIQTVPRIYFWTINSEFVCKYNWIITIFCFLIMGSALLTQWHTSKNFCATWSSRVRQSIKMSLVFHVMIIHYWTVAYNWLEHVTLQVGTLFI
jgi:hypothetical protein